MSKDYFMVVVIICLCKHTFSPKMPDISHCDYFANRGRNALQLDTGLFGIMENCVQQNI